ncbi:MAG: putative lipid II flippase FtsW [Firmicutes bacterium]|nr:putative lipid II flippase FtsW [Bacillota bacterium]
MSDRKNGDFIFIFTVAILVIIGIVMVFSASYYTALNAEGDAYHYLKRQLIWVAIGTFVMIVASRFPYKILGIWAMPILLGAGVLLLLVWTPLGVEINEARRWIGVGSITVMPGELAKPAIAIFVAKYLSRKPGIIKDLKNGVLPTLLVMVIFAGLIMVQPSMSTAMTLCGIVIFIMIAAGMKVSHLAALGIAGVSAAVVLIVTSPYRMLRATSFMDPFADPLGTGFQAVQSLLALGSGGLFGVGLGKSIQKTLYLPEPMNDFIFSIIGEELGFIGCLIIIALYIVFIWRGIHIAINAKDMFGMLLATGLTAMIAIQVVLNIAVVTSSMPPTGVSLPFISWGGSSLVVLMGCAGIMVNISKNSVRY